MQVMSCYDGIYRAWGKIIAAQGVAVAMVDFRNCLVASSAHVFAIWVSMGSDDIDKDKCIASVSARWAGS